MTQQERVSAVALLDEPVRRHLYEWVIAQDEPVGREAAAKAVGIQRALAAFHLDRLAEAGLLDTGYRRLTGRTGPGAGRPARVYSRTRQTLSVSVPARDYERVANLFAAALEKMGAQTPPPALEQLAEDLGDELGRGAEGGGGSDVRLLGVLRDNGYQPIVDGQGAIRLRNCPFDALVDEHRPLVCGTNLAVAEGIVKGAGADQYHPVIDQRPGYCCVAFLPTAMSAD
jgi:predicted ArsR family transcriptional regulator